MAKTIHSLNTLLTEMQLPHELIRGNEKLDEIVEMKSFIEALTLLQQQWH
ncbi:hypothetical protein [Acinetobacter nectaris]|nr:hypothetical protein [Acinetobacter nectaris]MCF8998971.1 hypothetical protein [Acinetobacter nectaris]MCF9027436.1 hypothetical protein [Acinetobacter nectaris]